jgi:NAD(P)-dependent dehydrogenase (short-subunit alcohol dehydrogenase family)
MAKLQWIYTFDDTPAALLRAKTWTKIHQLEGFTGLIKTLYHEYPGKRLGAVTIDTAIDPAHFGACVIGELTNEKPFPEVFYKGKTRFLLLPEISPSDESDGEEKDKADAGAQVKGFGLTKASNILVLGGAQGITPSLVARFAEDCPCNYILAGRSVIREGKDDLNALGTIDEIRKHLIETEGLKKPKEIEQKAKEIFKENQILKSVARIEKSGAKVRYHSVDVCDADAFRAFILRLKEEHGSIDGVIHAAGILEDKLFSDKKADSFARVYNTKVQPLTVILKTLLPELKLLVLFSSMSASFGNAGQCDYAAGNSVMDIAARILRQKNPQTRTIAFNWGPWKGAGMVHAGLENEFRKKGIAFLPLDEGSDFFAREILRDDEPGVLAIAGDEAGIETFMNTALR